MSVSVSFSGTSYSIPTLGDSPPSVNWGPNLTSFFQGLAANALPRSGGLFTLNGSDLDLGATYGIKSVYFKSRAATIAGAGTVRLENNGPGIGWRNAANSADLALTVNGSNQLTFNGVAIQNAAVYTASRAIVSDGAGALTAATTTAAEIGYVNGVTSSIQTQLDGKQATGNYITALTGDVTATGPGSVAATIANLAVTTGKLDNLAVTAGKIANDTITNTQVNSAAAIAVSKLAALTASRAVVTDVSGFISAATTTADQVGYLSTTTSDVQVQLDAKQRVIDRATATVSSHAAAETDLYSYSMPGNTMGTKSLRIVARMRLEHDATPPNITIKAKFGATTFFSTTINPESASVSDQPYILQLYIAPDDGATNAQYCTGTLTFQNQSNGQTTPVTLMAAAAEDTTGAVAVKITAEWTSDDATDIIHCDYVTTELI